MDKVKAMKKDAIIMHKNKQIDGIEVLNIVDFLMD